MDRGSGTRVRPRILLVEGNRSDADVAIALLGSDFEIAYASDSTEVRARFARYDSFDVVLCEVFTPRPGGYALLQWARSAKPDLVRRFVFLTNDADSGLARILARSHTVLRKPLVPRQLYAAVEAILAGKEAPFVVTPPISRPNDREG